ncbi:hypothetical protein, partial [Candidatus Aalborgicola defluviihabitans]|uniref:hypothetical protein n=1 Tax=Candidatus Aalborgicola defluviihabitans TaxID=3386187 RepID=UPI0039B89BA2
MLATGVTPRTPAIDWRQTTWNASYLDVLRDGKSVGKTVAVIGAGGSLVLMFRNFSTHSSTSASVDAP